MDAIIDPAELSIAAPVDMAADAAVMVMLLEDDQAAAVLSRLAPAELTRLGARMCELGAIGPEAIGAAVVGFVERIEAQGPIADDRIGQFRHKVTRAVGQVRADNLMRRIQPDVPASSIEIIRWLLPDAIVPLIRDEHPQAIAVLLVQLDAEVAAAVLHALPEGQQFDLVRRVATIGKVSADAIAMLDTLLTRRIGECHGQATMAMGGPREAAAMINGAGRGVERRVMPAMTKADKVLAKAIEHEMFRFEHLYELGTMAMGAVLREVDSDTLIVALKGIAADERTAFLSAMSARAAEGVTDEIDARGRVKLADVIAAQKQMVATARRLAADGVIQFGSGDDDYV